MNDLKESYSLKSTGVHIFYNIGVITHMIEHNIHTYKCTVMCTHLNILLGICLILNISTKSLNEVIYLIFEQIHFEINFREMKNNVDGFLKRWNNVSTLIKNWLSDFVFVPFNVTNKSILEKLTDRLFIISGNDIISSFVTEKDVLNSILYSISIIGITNTTYKIAGKRYSNLKIPTFKNNCYILDGNTVIITDTLESSSVVTLNKKHVDYNLLYAIVYSVDEKTVLKKSFSKYIIRSKEVYKKLFNKGVKSANIFFGNSPVFIDNKYVDFFEKKISN